MEDEVDGEDGSVAAPPPGAPAGSSQLSKKAMAKLERERAAHYEELQQRTARHDKMARTLQRIGIVMMATILGMAFGGYLSGAIFDAFSSYRMAFFNGLLWNMLNLGIVAWLFLRPRLLAKAA